MRGGATSERSRKAGSEMKKCGLYTVNREWSSVVTYATPVL